MNHLATAAPFSYTSPPTTSSQGTYLSPTSATLTSSASQSQSQSSDSSNPISPQPQYSSITPLLTPNTRAEAEEALSSNSFFQTSAAAPAITTDSEHDVQQISQQSQQSKTASRRRPMVHPRSQSSSYEEALRAAALNASASMDGTISHGGPQERSPAGYSVRFGRQQGCTADDMKKMLSERLLQGQPLEAGYFSTAMG